MSALRTDALQFEWCNRKAWNRSALQMRSDCKIKPVAEAVGDAPGSSDARCGFNAVEDNGPEREPHNAGPVRQRRSPPRRHNTLGVDWRNRMEGNRPAARTLLDWQIALLDSRIKRMATTDTPQLLRHITPIEPEHLVGDLIQPDHPWFGAIWMNPERMGGEPCFYASRVSVKTLFDYLEAGHTLGEFLDDFEGVTREQATAVLEFARMGLLHELPKA